MLRRVENVSAELIRDLWGWLTGGNYRVHLTVGRKTTIFRDRTTAEEFRDRLRQSDSAPMPFGRIGERMYWCFEERWYWDNDGLGADEVRALLKARASRRVDSINRAKTLAALDEPRAVKRMRSGIPDDVKQLVWARDRGACQGCGSRSELQFDHVIPHSMGGGSTEANLQLLCGPCNRRKGASLV